VLINTQANSLKWGSEFHSEPPPVPNFQTAPLQLPNSGYASTSTHPAQELQFGPLALTRMMCSSAPINEQIPKHWDYVRSYLLKDVEPIFNRSNPRPSS